MQPLINVLAISSFVVSSAVVGSGVYIYQQQDFLIEQLMNSALEASTEALTESFIESPSGLIPTPLEVPLEPSQALPDVF
jgi:hypothetical protein